MIAVFLLFLLLQMNPLDLPVSIAGTYGEMRSGRFHAGVDFRVGGKVGEKIYAIGDGYVSRIAVSPTGYGNGLYVQLNDGHLCVHGHLLKFNPSLAALVKKKQYERQSFVVDLYFKAGEIPVKKGDLLGYVGNSGSSAGPHLHFEMRNREGTMPVNSFTAGYIHLDQPDRVPPIIHRVNFYSFEDSTGVVESRLLRSMTSGSSAVMTLTDKFYVAVDAIDYQENTHAKLGIEEYTVTLDGKTVYDFKLGNYTYEEQKGFNALIDYAERIRSGKNMVKTFVEPGHTFKKHLRYVDRGLLILEDDQVHTVRVSVRDLAGNKAQKTFKVKRGRKDSPHLLPKGDYVAWYLPYVFSRDGLSFGLQPSALFNSTVVAADTVPASHFKKLRYPVYSDIWRIGSEKIPVKGSGSLVLETTVPERLKDKAVLARISEGGTFYYGGGRYRDGKMEGSLPYFGNYCVTVDTIAPVISARFNNNCDISGSSRLSFTIRDEFSGIASYKAEVDGKWILAAYDAKYSKLEVVMDGNVVRRGGKHRIEVTVADNKGNSTTKRYSFKW